ERGRGHCLSVEIFFPEEPKQAGGGTQDCCWSTPARGLQPQIHPQFLEGVMMRRHTLTNENRAYNERQQLVRRTNNLGATSPFGRLTRRPEGTLNCRPL